MTRRKKQMYGAVLLCGATAMLADRLLVGSRIPPPVSGEASDATMAATVSQVEEDRARSGAAIPEIPFPRALPVFGTEYVIRDPFVPPALLRLDRRGAEADNHGHAPPAPVVTEADFRAGHRLQGVFSEGDLRWANIDGTWMKVGDELSGCTIVRIAETHVVLSCDDDATVSLELFPGEPAPSG